MKLFQKKNSLPNSIPEKLYTGTSNQFDPYNPEKESFPTFGNSTPSGAYSQPTLVSKAVIGKGDKNPRSLSTTDKASLATLFSRLEQQQIIAAKISADREISMKAQSTNSLPSLTSSS